jgi:filamentous hemagglutinin family protein
MFAQKIRRSLRPLLTGALLTAACLTSVRAEVVLQGSSTPLPGPAITVNGNIGQTRGSNLFHSFSVFNILRPGTSASGLVVPQQESVTFTSPTVGGTPVSITNVINRVTGGTSTFTLQKSSLIDGPLNSSIPGANFWFINPNGIIFGGNAVLPTTGSFHASTADYIKLSDGNIFAATPTSNEVLTVAPPSAFGFLSANPAGIQVGNATRILQVPAGRTLSLVGGTIDVGIGNTQGFLLAPVGRLNLVSVASAGEATFNPAKINGPLNTDPDPFQTREINVDNFTKLGDINIRGGPSPGTSLVDGKEIFIRSGNLTVNNSFVMPGIFADLGLANQAFVANGGQVKIRANGDVTVTGDRLIFNIDSGIRARAGSASATATTLTAPRDVPDISVEAGGTLKVSGIATVRSEKYTQSTSSPVSFGNVAITADTVDVLGGAAISATSFIGKGGDLSVNAREIVLDAAGNAARFTGLTTQTDYHPAYPRIADPRLTNGEGGALTVNADTLTIKNGANLTADSFALGNAGNIMINVRDLFLSRDGAANGSISSQSGFAGNAGNITIRASDVIQLDQGQISATTNGSGKGGSVDIAAGKSLTISGTNGGIISLTAPPPTAALDAFALKLSPFFQARFGVTTPNFNALVAAIKGRGVSLPNNAGIFDVLGALNNPPFSITAVTELSPGHGGQISAATPSLVMNAGTRIDSSTLWDGNAGQIAGNVGSLTLQDGAQIRSQSGNVAATSGQPLVGSGNGGSVIFTVADSLLITGSNSAVSTNTFGNGNAGSISLSANQVNVQNGGSVTSESGGTLAGQFFAGTGNAGEITLSTPTLTMADGGAISVKTSGGGNAGNISLNVGNFTQAGGARVDSSTLGAGRGGDLTVTANSASISGPGTGLFSTASGSGAGGNIRIQAGQLVQLSNAGTISAQSTGTATATAGDININTPTFQSQNSSVTTGATLADGGNISIATTGSLVRLTDSQVTTSVQGGVGNGGNIAIDSKLIVLDDSQILARAVRGHGGNININSDVFLVNSGGTVPTSLAGIVDASSELSTSGTVNIEATFTNVVGTVAQLPSTPLQATELLRASCAARFAGGKTSSLVLAGRDGLPLQPGDLLPSPLYLASEADTPSTGNKVTGGDVPMRFSLLGSKDRLPSQYSLLPNMKCSL